MCISNFYISLSLSYYIYIYFFHILCKYPISLDLDSKFQFHGLFSAKHQSGVGLVFPLFKWRVSCGPDASSPRMEEGEKVQGLRSPRLRKFPWWLVGDHPQSILYI